MDYLQALVNGIMYGGVYSLIGIGYTLIFGTMNQLNLAHGQVIVAGTFLGLSVILFLGSNLVVASVVSVVGAVVVGLVVERVCFRTLRRAHALAPLISTLGAGIFLEELMVRIFTSETRLYPNPLSMRRFEVGGLYFRADYVLILVVSVLLMVGLNLLISRTRIGLAMRAVAENPVASRLMGISLDRVGLVTFGIASGIGGAAGVLISMSTSSASPVMASFVTLKGLVVTVIGGMGSVRGAGIAGVLLGIVELESIMFFTARYRDAIAYALLFGFLLLRPMGLSGETVGREV